MTHQGITYKHHLRLGHELARAQEELSSLAVVLSNIMGKTKPATLAAFKAAKAITMLRCHLDTELNRLIPRGDPREKNVLLVYYPLSNGTQWQIEREKVRKLMSPDVA